MGRLLRMQTIYSFFLSFICVTLFAHAIVRAYQMHVCKKKKKMQAQWKTKRPCIFFFFFFFFFFFCLFVSSFFFYCKDLAQTARMHIHMLIWNIVGHMFSWSSSLISCKSFFYCKDLDHIAQMHMHAYADLELCWSDVSWASLYISFKFFAFAKVLTRPYFTYVYLLQ